MWKSDAGGRTLHFHLAGINNQNFLMRDEETGSWWQQVTGCAILGPLKGTCLQAAPWDEVTFAVWKQEHPDTLVLMPDESVKKRYAPAGWEKKVAELPSVLPVDPRDGLQPRELVLGVTSGGVARAYPWTTLVTQNPIIDSLGGTPLFILLHPDGSSVRCFDRRVDGRTLELFAKVTEGRPAIVDSRTGGEWDFSGRAIGGPLEGRQLARVTCLKDYWFDWRNYHPDTGVFAAGMPDRGGAASPE